MIIAHMKKFLLKIKAPGLVAEPASIRTFELVAKDIEESLALQHLTSAGVIVAFGPKLEELVIECVEVQVQNPEEQALEDLREVIQQKYPGGGVGMTLQETSPGAFIGNLHHSRGSQVRMLCSIDAQPSRLAGVQALLVKAKELVP